MLTVSAFSHLVDGFGTIKGTTSHVSGRPVTALAGFVARRIGGARKRRPRLG